MEGGGVIPKAWSYVRRQGPHLELGRYQGKNLIFDSNESAKLLDTTELGGCDDKATDALLGALAPANVTGPNIGPTFGQIGGRPRHDIQAGCDVHVPEIEIRMILLGVRKDGIPLRWRPICSSDRHVLTWKALMNTASAQNAGRKETTSDMSSQIEINPLDLFQAAWPLRSSSGPKGSGMIAQVLNTCRFDSENVQSIEPIRHMELDLL